VGRIEDRGEGLGEGFFDRMSFACEFDSANDRSEPMDPTRLSVITPKSRLMVTPTPPMQLSLQCIIPLHQFTQTIPPFNDSYQPAHSLSSH
jgi:hypothetical protein